MTAVLDARRAWLAKRRESLGASDVAAVLGYDRHRTALQVYASKVGDDEGADSPAMRWGRKAESLVAEMYAEETERPVVEPDPYEILAHPELPWLTTTLDRRTLPSASHPAPESVVAEHGFSRIAAGPVPLEAKVQHGARAAAWEMEPPTGYQMQVMVQLSVTRAPWGSICAAIGWPPKPVWYDLVRDDAFLAAAMPKLEAFWFGCVVARVPPAPTSHLDLEPLRRLYPVGNGETVPLNRALLLGHEYEGCGEDVDTCDCAPQSHCCHDPQDEHYDDPVALVAAWEAERAAITRAAREADKLEAQLRARVGAATFGALTDGTFLHRKLTSRRGYTVEPCKYTVLSRRRPRLKRR